jgi:poly(3-hydroxybutyrate) depolymerase
MLYHVYEFSRAALQPYRAMAEAGQYLSSSPFSPLSYTYGGKAISAALKLFRDVTQRFGKPAFNLPARERILLRKPFCQLVRFEPDRPKRDAPRVLLVAPMSGHYATLLRGTVEALIPDHDVTITDWRDARMVPNSTGRFDLDDFIDYIIDFIRLLGPDVHVIAVCQPSVPVLAAVSLMAAANDPAAPRSLTLMGGPVDTRRNPQAPNQLATSQPLSWFERHMITRVPFNYPGFMRRVYPGFLQLQGFMSMNLDQHIDAHVRQFNHLIQGDGDNVEKHQAFYDEYMAVMDLTAEFYLDTIKTVFQDHALPRGEMKHRGQLVEPAAITRTALFTIEGEHDDITGLGQTRAAHDLCTGLADDQRQHYEQKGVGHYGVFNGRRWRQHIAPRIADFIRVHE